MKSRTKALFVMVAVLAAVGIVVAGLLLRDNKEAKHTPPVAASSSVPSTIPTRVPDTASSSASSPTGPTKSRAAASGTPRHLTGSLLQRVIGSIGTYYYVHVATAANGQKQVAYGYLDMPPDTKPLPPLKHFNATGEDTLKKMCLSMRATPAKLHAVTLPGKTQQVRITGNAELSFAYETTSCTPVDGNVQNGTPFIPSDGEDPVTITQFTSIWQQIGGQWWLLYLRDVGPT